MFCRKWDQNNKQKTMQEGKKQGTKVYKKGNVCSRYPVGVISVDNVISPNTP